MLRDFAKAEQDWLDDLMRGISDGGVPYLADGGDGGAKFSNAIGLRMTPPPRKKPVKKAEAPKPDPEPAQEDTRSPLQKLMDKFS